MEEFSDIFSLKWRPPEDICSGGEQFFKTFSKKTHLSENNTPKTWHEGWKQGLMVNQIDQLTMVNQAKKLVKQKFG